jgi:hypothetical protein
MTTEPVNHDAAPESLDVPRRRIRPPLVPTPQPPTDDAHVAVGSSLFSDPSKLKTEEVPREEDPRTRAARRAAELREHLGDNLGDGVDEFFVDPRIIPDGWSYEWKRHMTLGAQDPSYQVSLARGGWDAVPAHRHPELMPDNWRGATIERRGMILMERPAEITEQVKARELRKAREQVGQKEQQLYGAPPGTFERDNKGNPLVKVGRSYEALAIPKE